MTKTDKILNAILRVVYVAFLLAGLTGISLDIGLLKIFMDVLDVF